jgi:hypothetical protein
MGEMPTKVYDQGDQMILWKITQNETQPIFWQNLLWNQVHMYSKKLFVLVQKNHPKANNRPIGVCKFAQSGHPVYDKQQSNMGGKTRPNLTWIFF